MNDRFDLYWAPADGSAVQARITNRGSNPAPPRSVAYLWYVHPDGERVIYLFDEFAALDHAGSASSASPDRTLQTRASTAFRSPAAR